MEGELATAGIKEGAKWAGIDFRNPCLSIDFGTTLDGRITNDESPYASTTGNFAGYAGAIPDAIIQGTHLVDEKVGTTLDLFDNKKIGMLTWTRHGKKINEYSAVLRKSKKDKIKIKFKGFISVFIGLYQPGISITSTVKVRVPSHDVSAVCGLLG